MLEHFDRCGEPAKFCEEWLFLTEKPRRPQTMVCEAISTVKMLEQILRWRRAGPVEEWR
jgi:hypothetical protein